jgi:hypothetical protein
MIIGLSIAQFTILHVIITLIAIASGFIVLFGLLGSKRLPAWTAIFWIFTALTSVTGFMFFLSPGLIKGFTPATGTGIVAMIVFIIALFGLYVKHLMGAWRWLYALTTVVSLYLNVFVLIVQSFEKVKFLNPTAPMVGPPFAEPTMTHFAIAQGVTLLFFGIMGILAAIRFRPSLQITF